MKRVIRIAGWIVAALVVLAALVFVSGWFALRGSLAQLDGRVVLPGLAGSVTVERDQLGTPTIRGTNRLDVARATGFVHAQDRFFQMDLQRRYAAGEISALFGPIATGGDRRTRLHRFRARAREAWARAGAADRELIAAYTEGVNAGLSALRVRPFEYLALRSEPVPWQPEDSLLVAWSMFLDLQPSDGRLERSRAAMQEVMTPELYQFFTANGSAWNATFDGSSVPLRPVPGPEHFRFLPVATVGHGGTGAMAESAVRGVFGEQLSGDFTDVAPGSNNWAVAGRLTTRGGGAIVANDMHLSLRNLPGIWYRARFLVEPAAGPTVDVCGVTIPGAPIMVAGSNGHVAWGFTNSNVDVADVVVVEFESPGSNRYWTTEGWREIERREETIEIKGGAAETVVVEETIWGPLLPKSDSDGATTRFALAWIAHDTARVNLAAVSFETAHDVDEALAVSKQAWFPAQNLVVGDRDGRIAWTVLGPVPRRVGFDGMQPVSMADGTRRWAGVIPDAPVIVDPLDGRLATANVPVVGGESEAALGDGGFRHDGRAFQIRERLRARESFDEIALFEIQNDDETLFLRRWRDLALRTLDERAVTTRPERGEFRRLIEEWNGRAERSSRGHRLVRQFRREVADVVLGRLFALCRMRFRRFSYMDCNYEEPLWMLVSGQHEWTAASDGWQSELLRCVDRVIDDLTRDGRSLGDITWGEHNRLDMCHPLARAVPALRPWLGAAREPMAGDSYAPDALYRTHGPSERMVVSPGRESSGILHTPGGQSGHPLSPYFLASHAAWVRGEATPFLPGDAKHRLELNPAPGER